MQSLSGAGRRDWAAWELLFDHRRSLTALSFLYSTHHPASAQPSGLTHALKLLIELEHPK